MRINARYINSEVQPLGDYRRQKIRALRALKGIPNVVDNTALREKLNFLSATGFSDYALGAASGITQRTLWSIRTGRTSSTRIEQAARVMSLTHIPVPSQSGYLVAGIGTHRRLKALQAAGYTHTQIAAELGVSRRTVAAYGTKVQVRYETWAAVRDTYDRMSPTPGVSLEAARVAVRYGHFLPMEWEGYDIDDPRVIPPRARRTGNETDPEKLEIRRAQIAEWTRCGLTQGEIAARLGVSIRTVERDRAVAS